MKRGIVFILFFCSFTFTVKCSDSLFQKGIDELVKGNYQQAQNNFQQGSIENPNFSNYYNLGVTSGNLGDWSKAKWAFESALKYNPLNEDAEYNAKFATQKITQSKEWHNPYSVGKSVIIGFGSVLWIFFAILFSIFSGLFLYIIFRKDKKNSVLMKWSLRLVIPAIFLFMVSYFCVYSINNHFNQQTFAILKGNDAKFFISPNGVEANNEIDLSGRYQIVKYTKDSTWVQLKSQKNNVLWIDHKEIYSY